MSGAACGWDPPTQSLEAAAGAGIRAGCRLSSQGTVCGTPEEMALLIWEWQFPAHVRVCVCGGGPSTGHCEHTPAVSGMGSKVRAAPTRPMMGIFWIRLESWRLGSNVLKEEVSGET